MRRPTPLDRIAREERPKTWETVIVRARAEGNDIILPDGLVFPACRPKESTCPAGLRGKTARDFREHVIAHARPATDGLPRSPTSAVFSSPAGCTSPVCARPPFQMTHAGFHRKTPARSTQNRRRQSSAARNGACSPLRRVFRLGLSDESRHLLPRFRPCTATLAPQLCLPEGLRHTVFWNVLPKSCLFLLHGAFSMYIFSRIKNKTPLRSKRNNVNERIGLITGMI